MLHDFGGNRDLYGNLTHIATAPVDARTAPGSTMVGTGLTMEAIEQNPVIYELMSGMHIPLLLRSSFFALRSSCATQADGLPVFRNGLEVRTRGCRRLAGSLCELPLRR
jgi:hypothetical protein